MNLRKDWGRDEKLDSAKDFFRGVSKAMLIIRSMWQKSEILKGVPRDWLVNKAMVALHLTLSVIWRMLDPPLGHTEGGGGGF